jgi:RNA polymerase sigma-70 factor, ECF subfamily
MYMDRRVRFELLYAKYGPLVKAYALRRTRPSIADDVVAEVFLVCWRRFEEVPADPLPWLLGIARRVLSTQHRGEQRRLALAERLHEVPLPDAPSVSGPDGSLGEALAGLGEGDRELLLLIAWEGLSPAQAAVVLRIKPATARVRLMRARRRLAQLLAQADAPPCVCAPVSAEVSR